MCSNCKDKPQMMPLKSRNRVSGKISPASYWLCSVDCTADHCFEVCTLHYSKAVQKSSKSQMIHLFMAIVRSYVKVPAGRMRCAEEPWHWVSKPFDIIQHLSFNVFSALKTGLSPISIAFKTCVTFLQKKTTEIPAIFDYGLSCDLGRWWYLLLCRSLERIFLRALDVS